MTKHSFNVCLLMVLLFLPGGSFSIAEVLKNIANIDSYRNKCYERIISLKNENDGWGYETPRVITSLQLADNSWASQNLASLKQMEVELLSELLNEDIENPMRAGRLAMFIFGLVSTCQDTRNFYQKDLVDKLKPIRTYNSFELGYVSLALCVTGTITDEKNIDLMISYLHNFTYEETYMRDYAAILLQAIECISQLNPSSNLTSTINKATNELKKSQNIDGSFGNIDTSAVVTQALLNANDDGWNATAIIYYFLNSQKRDGTIGNNAATVQIYPTLYAKNYINLLHTKCTTANQPRTTTTFENLRSTVINTKVSINYSLWIGNDASKKIRIKLTFPMGLSFYEVMKIAASKDSRYKFEASESSFGHYIRSINGIRENLTANTFWMLSILKDNDQLPIMSEKGVDSYYPENRDHVVFWYKTVSM